MSSLNSFTPISIIEENDNNNELNSISYNELINFGAIRKQFARIIPNHINFKNQRIGLKKKDVSNLEEYKKLKQEIISMEKSILLLKEKKQNKLDQIEELRNLMRKEGQKKIIYNDKKQNKNNYYNREKKDVKHFGYDKKERKGGFGNIKSSFDAENGCSIASTNSGLSDKCCDDEAIQGDGRYRFYRNSSNNSSSNSFINFFEETNKFGKILQKEMQQEELIQYMDN